MANPAIDLSAGLIPKAQAAPIDLSAGLVPAKINPPSAAPNSALPWLDQTGSAVGDFARGAVKGVGNTISGVSDAIHSIPGIGPKIIPDAGLNAFHQQNQPSNTAQSVGRGVEQAGEWLMPTGLEEKAGLYGAKALPAMAKFAAPAARVGTAALESGVRNKVQGGGFGVGAAAGGIGSGIGAGLRAAAPTMAEAALNVLGKNRGFGRTPGQAIIADTKGLLPRTVADSAVAKSGQLTNSLESQVDAASNPMLPPSASLAPARQITKDGMAKATAQGSPELMAPVSSLDERLQKNVVTGQPYPQNVTPRTALDMRRGIGDLEKSWPMETQKIGSGYNRSVYGALSGEVHRTVPGTGELDQRISSLIPVAERANAADLNAGVLQRTMGRMGRPTGALVGASLGAGAGYKEDGTKGAIIGGVGGLVLPEVLNSPTAQMIAARMMAKPNAAVSGMKGLALQANRNSLYK